MAQKQYRALRDTLIAHENRIVRAGDVFVTEFPEHMTLSDNLELVEEDKPAGRKAKAQDGGDLV